MTENAIPLRLRTAKASVLSLQIQPDATSQLAALMFVSARSLAGTIPWPKNFRFIRVNNFGAVQLYK